MFQSTRPRGARPTIRMSGALLWCFNPRARAGRDGSPGRRHPRGGSFNPRARAGRDSGKEGPALLHHKVSIHAPARGATKSESHVQAIDPVSIHAPARGATRQKFRLQPPALFQSTRPRGARHAPWMIGNQKVLFQSTRPRGARLPTRVGPLLHQGFNPRARAGRDKTRRWEPQR